MADRRIERYGGRNKARALSAKEQDAQWAYVGRGDTLIHTKRTVSKHNHNKTYKLNTYRHKTYQ